MSTIPGQVATGRHLSRKAGYCLGCEARIRIGDPKPNATWPARIRELMSDELHDLLLVACAEYLELCREAGEAPDPVGLLDWMWPPVGTGNLSASDVALERRSA